MQTCPQTAGEHTDSTVLRRRVLRLFQDALAGDTSSLHRTLCCSRGDDGTFRGCLSPELLLREGFATARAEVQHLLPPSAESGAKPTRVFFSPSLKIRLSPLQLPFRMALKHGVFSCVRATGCTDSPAGVRKPSCTSRPPPRRPSQCASHGCTGSPWHGLQGRRVARVCCRAGQGAGL